MFFARRSTTSICSWIICALLVFASAPAALAQDEYVAQSISDTAIPVDELALMVKPLTRSELEGEVQAWIALVKEKAKLLSAAEIAIKRKNEEIASAEELAAVAEDDDISNDEVEQLAEEVQAAAERSEQDEDVRAAVEEASTTAVTAAAESQLENVEDLNETAASANQLAEATDAQKQQLLDAVVALRDEQTALIDRTRVVLDDVDAKGGDTEEHRQYLSAVSGVAVDVSDWDAIFATATGWIVSEQGGVRWGLNIAKFLALLAVSWVVSAIVGRIADRAFQTRYSQRLSTLMRAFLATLIRRAILVIGFVIALAALEVNTAPLLAAIGAAGFVVAFALQDSLSNFASGIMILLYRPFDVGDVVEIGGVSGKVTALNLVSVTIKSFDNKMVLVPNNSVWNDVITNATGVHQRRVDMVFGIGYEDDIQQAQDVLERIVQNHELVLDDPATVIKLHELADSSVNFICRPWVRTDDYWTVFWDVTRSVKEEFDKEGISIPYPQQDIHVHQVAAQDSASA